MRSALLASATAAALTVVPVAATGAAKVPRPPGGAWVVAGGKKSGFTLDTKNRITKLRYALTAADASGCGTGVITVKKKLKLSLATRGGYSVWIVGKSTPKTSNGITPIPATYTQNGKNITGTIEIFWDYNNIKAGSVELAFGPCNVSTSMHKKK